MYIDNVFFEKTIEELRNRCYNMGNNFLRRRFFTMGILEDVLLNARTAVDTVGKKAGKVIDMSKLTLSAADIKSELSKKYEMLGRITFEAQTTNKDYTKSIADIVAKIINLKAELESVNEALASGKSKVKCSACGNYNDKDAIFCSKCGTKIVVKGVDAEEEIAEEDAVDLVEDNLADDDMDVQ